MTLPFFSTKKCGECGAVAYVRRNLSPTTLLKAPAWRAWLEAGGEGKSPGVAEVLWVVVPDDVRVPHMINGDGVLGLLEVVASTDGAPQPASVCPACRENVRVYG